MNRRNIRNIAEYVLGDDNYAFFFNELKRKQYSDLHIEGLWYLWRIVKNTRYFNEEERTYLTNMFMTVKDALKMKGKEVTENAARAFNTGITRKCNKLIERIGADLWDLDPHKISEDELRRYCTRAKKFYEQQAKLVENHLIIDQMELLNIIGKSLPEHQNSKNMNSEEVIEVAHRLKKTNLLNYLKERKEVVEFILYHTMYDTSHLAPAERKVKEKLEHILISR
ncbi:hypothetical protein [Bacillus sonorensis]|uniref:hypothetical protein n=1 Tax=Bacillus sonorensis TaxID=119858 RepID=UPI002DBED348|nr:hypothetical protein [Bacillus sonorensis]MEC0341896.1 hypothetical protein [Bacillus sonorensis]MEC0457418.1 hypothetical protein [Bacillus sonorensis]MEC0530787.1 hypothetical protein [Bacillus sonorensis]